MVSFERLTVAICILLAASSVAGCDKPNPAPAKKTIGHGVTQLRVRVGSIWGGGYTVDVTPQEYVVVEHSNCPDAKTRAVAGDRPKGLCAIRITKEQSDRFEAAMGRFKRYAVPLESISLEDPWVRPDRKPCKNQVTDSTLITLTWTGTEGIKIASFYTGCDEKEFANFYRSALAVTDPLPIQQIIGKR